ncbi:hypothetical protein Tco_0735653 [Tanacetum coccineum]
MVDPCTFMVDPSVAFSTDDPTKLMGFVSLVNALLLSNPIPILQLGQLSSLILSSASFSLPLQEYSNKGLLICVGGGFDYCDIDLDHASKESFLAHFSFLLSL